MKLLCTILALLVLMLSVQPACATVSLAQDSCCGEGGCNEEDGQNSSDEGDKGCTTGCNPFQVCACCAFGVVVPPQVPLPVFVPVAVPGINWGILFVGTTQEPSSGFWQPPRLA